MIARTQLFELRLDPEILDRIDEWRADQRDVPSRSAAVRRLVERGLGQDRDDQLFQLARFNLLVAAKSGHRLPPAYIYAWDEGVYPLFHDGARHLHQSFAGYFTITKDQISELSRFLDDRDLANDVPSFYELEDHYEVRSGRSTWDRLGLLASCRYMFLNGMFNEKFWDALLRGSDHPAEAKGITRDFDVDRDVYLN